MGERFPFFYYDIVARIIPAGLLIFLISLLDWSPWQALEEAWYGTITPKPASDPLNSALLAVILLGACYAIGVAIDSLSYVLRLRPIVEARLDAAFMSALKEHVWRRKPAQQKSKPNPSSGVDADRTREGTAPTQQDSERDPSWEELKEQIAHITSVRRHCWTWIELGDPKDLGRSFAHAHRFAAESKMFQHVGIVAVVFLLMCFCLACHRCYTDALYSPWLLMGWAVGTCAVGLCLCVAGFRARERRRWLQVITAIDELHSSKRSDESDALLESCRNLQRSKVPDESAILAAGRRVLKEEWKSVRTRCSARLSSIGLTHVVAVLLCLALAVSVLVAFSLRCNIRTIW